MSSHDVEHSAIVAAAPNRPVRRSRDRRRSPIARRCSARCASTAGRNCSAAAMPSTHLYLIGEGRVRLAVATDEGRELSFRVAGGGRPVRRDRRARRQSAQRRRDRADAVTVYALERNALRDAVVDARAPSRQRGRVLCRRLRETTSQLELIALYPLDVRLARFFCSRSTTGGAARQARPARPRVLARASSRNCSAPAGPRSTRRSASWKAPARSSARSTVCSAIRTSSPRSRARPMLRRFARRARPGARRRGVMAVLLVAAPAHAARRGASACARAHSIWCSPPTSLVRRPSLDRRGAASWWSRSIAASLDDDRCRGRGRARRWRGWSRPIAAAKPAAIAVDILFAEPDSRSPAALARRLGEFTGRPDLVELAETLPDGDRAAGRGRARRRRSRSASCSIRISQAPLPACRVLSRGAPVARPAVERRRRGRAVSAR